MSSTSLSNLESAQWSLMLRGGSDETVSPCVNSVQVPGCALALHTDPQLSAGTRGSHCWGVSSQLSTCVKCASKPLIRCHLPLGGQLRTRSLACIVLGNPLGQT